MNYNQQVIYVHRYLSGDMNIEEETIFKTWISQDEHNSKLYSDISAIWNSSVNDTPLTFDHNAAFLKHKMKIEQSVQEIETPKSKEFKIFQLRNWAAIAAGLTIFIAAWFVFTNNSGQTYTTDKGLMAALNDGSKVMMKEGSSVKYFDKEKERKIKLKGKAYFDVATDKSKPFIINADGLTIEVLGTIFTVDSETKSVFVKEGIVEVTFNEQKYKLTANQYLQLINGKVAHAENKTFDPDSLWFNEDLSFNKTPLDKVLNDISVYFNVKFELPQGKDWSNCTFTSGSLKDNTLEEIITTLRLTYELECVKAGENTYKVSRVKCK